MKVIFNFLINFIKILLGRHIKLHFERFDYARVKIRRKTLQIAKHKAQKRKNLLG